MAIYLSLKVAVMRDGMQGRIPPETTVLRGSASGESW